MKNTNQTFTGLNLATFAHFWKGKSGVYLWTNTVNGKCYVGSSNNIRRRLQEYLSPSKLLHRLNSGESIISRALLKYGYRSFSFEILEEIQVDSKITTRDKNKILRKLEQDYIDKLQPEYNILKLAGTNRGHVMSPETRAKMSARKKGKPSHRKGKTLIKSHRESVRVNSVSSKVVSMYSLQHKLLNTFLSIQECSKAIDISRYRIYRRMKAKKPLEAKYVLSFTPIP